MENTVTTARRSLGARLLDPLDPVWCSGCGADALMRVNVDGVWSYLCASCRDAFVGFLLAPLP